MSRNWLLVRRQTLLSREAPAACANDVNQRHMILDRPNDIHCRRIHRYLRGIGVHWPIVCLAFMVVLFFADSLFLGRAILMRDMFCDGLPWRRFAAQAFRDGAVPLWNQYSRYGQPFVANPQSAVFYPPHLLFVCLPSMAALKLSLALHLLLAGVSMFALCRHWKMAVLPALLAAVSLTFSSYMVAKLEFHSVAVAIPWCPLALLLASKGIEAWRQGIAQRAWRGGILRSLPCVLGLALVFSFQYLAGQPQPFAFTLMLVAAYVVARPLVLRELRVLAASVMGLILAAVLALCLSMPQFLLTWELVPLSIRAESMDPGLHMASVHPRHLLTVWLPFLYGRPGYFGRWWGSSSSLFEFWIGTYYVGILPLVMMSFALFYLKPERSPRKADASRFLCLFFIGMGVFGLLMAFGKYTPFYMLLYDYLPGFSRLRWPAKSLLLVVFSMSVLSGLGYQRFLEETQDSRRPWRKRTGIVLGAWLLVWICVAVGYVWVRQKPEFFQWLTHGAFQPDATKMADLLSDYVRALLFLGLGLAATGGVLLGGRKRKFAAAAILCVAYANLFVVSRQIHYVTDDEVYEVSTDSALPGISPSRLRWFRVHSAYAEAQQWMYGCRNTELYHWAKRSSLGEVWLPLRVCKTSGGGTLAMRRPLKIHQLMHNLPGLQRERLADLLSIRYVISGEPFQRILSGKAPPGVRWMERSSALPRARLVRKCHVVPDWRKALGLMLSASFDPLLEATLENAPSGVSADAQPGPEKDGWTIGRVISMTDGWNRVDLEVEADERALLVLNDVWYPGWVSKVDGQEKTILRANVLFRGVMVEPGRHKVEFTYRPWRFRFGIVVSGVTLLALIAGGALCLKFRTW